MKRLAIPMLLAACGTDPTTPPGPEVLPGLEVPPVPDNGFQIITPIVRDIQPGTDHEICTWTDQFFDATTDVKTLTGFQSNPGGHHIVGYYTTEFQPAGTQRECTDTDMASFRYLSGLGGDGIANSAPGNLVYRIPPGAQFVVNHHYLNAYDKVLDGQAIINVDYADANSESVPSSATAIVDTAIEVPQGTARTEIDCTFERALKFWYLIPHMHRWGTQISVDLTIDGKQQRYFDTTWDPSYTFHPPEFRKDPATPLEISPGDKIHIQCNWNNDSGRPLPFGFEMCVVFGQFVDDQGIGSRACDAGQWTDF